MIPYKLSIFTIDYRKKDVIEKRSKLSCCGLYYSNYTYSLEIKNKGFCVIYDNKTVTSSMRKYLTLIGYEEEVVLNNNFSVELVKDYSFKDQVFLIKGRKKYPIKLFGNVMGRILKDTNWNIVNGSLVGKYRVELYPGSIHYYIGLKSVESSNAEYYTRKSVFGKNWTKNIEPGTLFLTKDNNMAVFLGTSDKILVTSPYDGSAINTEIWHCASSAKFSILNRVYYLRHSAFKFIKKKVNICIKFSNPDNYPLDGFSGRDVISYLFERAMSSDFSSIQISSRPLCGKPIIKMCNPTKDFRSSFLSTVSISADSNNSYSNILSNLLLYLDPKRLVGSIDNFKSKYINECRGFCIEATNTVFDESLNNKNNMSIDYIISSVKTCLGQSIIDEWTTGVFTDPIKLSDIDTFILKQWATRSQIKESFRK